MQKKKNRKKIDWKNTLIYLLVLFVIIVIAHYINNIEMAANINIIEEEILKGESIGDNGLKVYFIDQTTPNMIQRLNTIFKRNPLISMGI